MTKLTITIESDGRTLTTIGRDAWALMELHRAGDKGCTPIDNPGPRWSAYVFKLRQLGLAIDTVNEPHDGPFPGTHARYVLRTPVRICAANDNEAE